MPSRGCSPATTRTSLESFASHAAKTFKAAEIHRVLACRSHRFTLPETAQTLLTLYSWGARPPYSCPSSILLPPDPIGVTQRACAISPTRSSAESRIRAADSRLRMLCALWRWSAPNKMASSRYNGRRRRGRYRYYITLQPSPFGHNLHAHAH